MTWNRLKVNGELEDSQEVRSHRCRASTYDELTTFLNGRDAARPERRLHRLLVEAYSAADGAYFFTLCARQHKDVFRNERLARGVVDALLWRKRKHDWRLFCYCLMPDHLHFVAQLPEESAHTLSAGARGSTPESILDQVGYFKKYTTTQLWWSLGGAGRLWQRSSYDRVLRQGESIGTVVAYVLENPVRKSLASRWEDYPYARLVDDW